MQLAHAVLAGSIFLSMPLKRGDHGISPLGPPSPTGGPLFRTTGVAREKRSNQLPPRTLALPIPNRQAASPLRSWLAFFGKKDLHFILIQSLDI